jgi:putative exosortase-associated protein (TIGR04073 family)
MQPSLRRVVRLASVVIVCSAWGASVSAEEPPKTVCPICEHAGSAGGDYPSKAGTTLVRGTANTLLGWTEIIRQPAQEAKRGGNVFIGIANGFGHGIKRTLAGLGEVVTFWTPKLNEEYVEFSKDCPICMGRQQAPATAQ